MTANVECAHDELVPLEKLVPNPRNPNRHSPKQIDLLAKIIQHQGWRAPITVSKRSGFIVRGHARLAAAQKLELDVAPVDYQDYDNEAAEWADMIADNRIAELAERDMPSLKDLLEELDTGAFDMDLTGYDTHALELLMAPPATGLEASAISGKDSDQGRFILVYETPEERQKLIDLLGIDGEKIVYTPEELGALGEG